MNKLFIKRTDVYPPESELKIHKQNHTYSATQLFDLLLSDSSFPQKAIKLAKKYGLDESHFLTYLAISVLEALGNDAPAEKTINTMESLLLEWYASKSEKIENLIGNANTTEE